MSEKWHWARSIGGSQAWQVVCVGPAGVSVVGIRRPIPISEFEFGKQVRKPRTPPNTPGERSGTSEGERG